MHRSDLQHVHTAFMYGISLAAISAFTVSSSDNTGQLFSVDPYIASPSRIDDSNGLEYLYCQTYPCFLLSTAIPTSLNDL